jgi:hypothetical protein
VAVLGLLAEGHERRAREVIGTNRTANAIRAAREDCARTARKLAEVYAADWHAPLRWPVTPRSGWLVGFQNSVTAADLRF